MNFAASWKWKTGAGRPAVSPQHARSLDREADPQWQKVYLREQEIDNTMLGTDALPVRSAADRARLYSDLAMVRVHVVDATGDVYRETRFYREAAAGWLRTSPAPVFWGQGQDLETRYFHINFRQADVDAVLPAASQLDKLYLDLRSDLGLAEPSEKLAIEVAPETLRTLGLLGFEEGRLIVPSPLLVQTPADLSDSAVLVQTVAPALVDQVWNEALYLVADNSQWHGIRPEWNSMLRGMQIWQARGGGATAARWYTDTTAWLYREALAIQSKQRAPMGLDWQTLCLQDSLWRRNVPTLVSLASLCLDPQWQFHLQYMAAAPVALSQLINSDDWEAAPSGPLHRDWVHSMAAATVVEYLVQTYGRDQLPLLLDSLRTHESWEAMTPELLGISAQEFENGWRAHLAEKYGFEEAMRNEQTGLPSGSHTSAIR